MKNSQHRQVLKSLEVLREEPNVPDDQAPVRACYRYIGNRPGQFSYKHPIQEELSIGSEEVKRGHLLFGVFVHEPSRRAEEQEGEKNPAWRLRDPSPAPPGALRGAIPTQLAGQASPARGYAVE